MVGEKKGKTATCHRYPQTLPQHSRKMDRNAADRQLHYVLHETTGKVLTEVKKKEKRIKREQEAQKTAAAVQLKTQQAHVQERRSRGKGGEEVRLFKCHK